jgi:hypothetical protein
MRARLVWWLLAATGCSGASTAPSIQWNTSRYAAGDVVELVPAIPLPIYRDRSRVRVMLRMGPGAITLSQDGQSLVFPPATQADRLEEFVTNGSWRVMDVRGEQLTPDGGIFHVLRPGDVADVLVGRSWDRAVPAFGDAAQQDMARTMAPHAAAAFLRVSQCLECHQPNRPVDRRPSSVVHRRTDHHGWHAVLATLLDEAPVESYRPWATVTHQPFVTLACGDGPAGLASTAHAQRHTCPDGQTPTAMFDLATALAAQDAHALAVCHARLALWKRMDAAAQQRFEPHTRACRAALSHGEHP